jgi:hypothetical protein
VEIERDQTGELAHLESGFTGYGPGNDPRQLPFPWICLGEAKQRAAQKDNDPQGDNSPCQCFFDESFPIHSLIKVERFKGSEFRVENSGSVSYNLDFAFKGQKNEKPSGIPVIKGFQKTI